MNKQISEIYEQGSFIDEDFKFSKYMEKKLGYIDSDALNFHYGFRLGQETLSDENIKLRAEVLTLRQELLHREELYKHRLGEIENALNKLENL